MLNRYKLKLDANGKIIQKHKIIYDLHIVVVCLSIYIPVGGCEECYVGHNFASCFTMSCGGCFSKHILYTAVIRGNLQSI